MATTDELLDVDLGLQETRRFNRREWAFEAIDQEAFRTGNASRTAGFDDKIISMYARGMTTRDIQGHLQEIYGIDVSPTLISQVTDAVV